MKLQSVLALAAMAGLASSASAQFITSPGITATFSMALTEEASTGNVGTIEPGERAAIRTNLSFTGQYTRVNFSPAIGSFTSGIIVGLGTCFVNVTSSSANVGGLYNNGVTIPPSSSVGPDANSGGTSGYGVRQFFRVSGDGSNGTQAPNGFINIQPGQFQSSPSAPGVQYTNPITNMDRLQWTPADYSARTVNFAVSAAAGAGQLCVGLYLDFDGTTGGAPDGSDYASGNTGGVAYIPLNQISFGNGLNIPLAPAPSSLALLGLGGLIAGRRRR